MNEKEVMLNAFSKYFNKTDEELTAMLYEGEGDNLTLKEGAADLLIELDTQRVGRIRTEASEGATKKFDDFAKKTKREVLEKFEKDLKAQYNLESDKTGLELIEDLTASVSKNPNITEESLKTNPIYLKLERGIKEAYEGQISTVKGEFDSYKSQVEKGKVVGSVKSQAEAVFLALNPVLSDDPVKAKNQRQEFLRRFEGFDYIIDGDNIMVKSGDGRLEDGHGNPIKFDAFVRTEAEKLYDFKKQERRESPGNKGGGADASIRISREEYNKMVIDADYDDEKLAALAKYEVV